MPKYQSVYLITALCLSWNEAKINTAITQWKRKPHYDYLFNVQYASFKKIRNLVSAMQKL